MIAEKAWKKKSWKKECGLKNGKGRDLSVWEGTWYGCNMQIIGAMNRRRLVIQGFWWWWNCISFFTLLVSHMHMTPFLLLLSPYYKFHKIMQLKSEILSTW